MKGRDPQRIERMLAILRDLWSTVPDWRLGQLIVNASEPPADQSCPHVFFLEDTEMEKLLVRMRDRLRESGQGSPMHSE